MRVALAVAGYSVWFGLVEAATRRWRINREASRKLAHVSCGLAAAALPLVMSFGEITLLGFVFVLLLGLSRQLGILSSIHDVERTTWGEVYFPLGVAITAAMFPQRAIFIYAVLTMALSDMAAWFIGRRFGRRGYRLGLSRKTYMGSAAFFLTTIAIGGLVALAQAIPPTVNLGVQVLGASAVSALTEAAAARGLDNLLVPISVGGVLWLLQALNMQFGCV
jgi:phytol kinase